MIRIDAELKAQIDAFIAERRNKKSPLDEPSEEVVNMDVSTD
jgi:ubiquitin conjugation factor E4 B